MWKVYDGIQIIFPKYIFRRIKCLQGEAKVI